MSGEEYNLFFLLHNLVHSLCPKKEMVLLAWDIMKREVGLLTWDSGSIRG